MTLRDTGENMKGAMSGSRQAGAGDELDLRELLSILRRQRLLLILPALVLACIVLVLALVLPKEYTAKTILSSVEDNTGSFGGGGLGSMVSRYKGLASLAGISMPEDEKKEESIALLKSTLITEEFIREQNLLPVLYSRRWNSVTKRWREGERVPTLWQGSRYFEDHIRTVTEDAKTGLIELDITWRDPAIAAEWANSLVQLTNRFSQQKAVGVAKRHIAFLNQKAKETPYVDEREGIFEIMQDQLTSQMIAEGTDEYALNVIDPAFAPEKPDYPRPILWTLLALLAGLAIGCLIVLVRYNLGISEEEGSTGIALHPNSLTAKRGLADPSAAIDKV